MIKRTGTSLLILVLSVVGRLTIVILQTIGRIAYAPFVLLYEILHLLIRLARQNIQLKRWSRLYKLKLKTVPKQRPKKAKKPFVLPRLPIVRFVYQKWMGKIIISVFTIFLISGAVMFFYYWILKDLPKPDRLATQQPPLTTKLYDRSGRLLYKIYRDQNRTLVPLENIPIDFINATIAIEDKRFFEHSGFSVEGVTRALKRNVFNKQMEGGSTITQQLIKNTLLTPEKTLQRKIKELILSFQTELLFSKEEILAMYLNTVPYGGTAYGVEEAAQTYFNKSIKDLGLAESALLAGLPAAPSKYSPLGATPELSIVRQHEVFRRMVEDNYISPFQAEKAKTEKVYLAPIKNHILAPHFVMYLKNWLVEKYGLRRVEQGGLTAISSLDLNIQNIVQNAVENEVAKLRNMNVTNGAALVIRPQTGEILAMVGSKDYFDQTIDGNVNVILQPRQPGSTIKVINYAYALGHGYTAASIISDSPISYQIPGQPAYKPVNYDSKFHGNVTLRQALASSYNIPAVKVLASFGVDKMIAQGETMGITTWSQPERFGLSLTLGGGEVKMIDLATVYGVLANNGNKTIPSPILAVKDANKQNLDKNNCFEGLVKKPNLLTCWAKEHSDTNSTCTQKAVLDPAISFILSSILSDNQARTPAFGPSSLLNIDGHQVSVKTGTTNDKRDNWCIGYTKDFLTAVWVGNNDNQPMSAVASGITGATPIWNKIMTELLKNESPRIPLLPPNVAKVPICSLNGLRSCQGCPTKDEYFIKGTEPKYACNSEEVNKIIENRARQKQNQLLQGLSTSR